MFVVFPLSADKTIISCSCLRVFNTIKFIIIIIIIIIIIAIIIIIINIRI